MKNGKIRTALAYLVSLLPASSLRVLLYRALFGYRITRSFIGWGTIIAVDSAEIMDCRIGRRNRFIGPMRVTVRPGARIMDRNAFVCGWWAAESQFEAAGYARRLHVGERCLITSEHHIDVVGAFVLGDGSWIAGARSQFWTHGAGAHERDITIGAQCYVGSGVLFAPGASIGSNCIVGLGSVVTKALDGQNLLIAGHPARILKENHDWRAAKRAASSG